MFIPYYYLPTYGLAHGMSSYMAQNLLATLNAGSLVGRISSGIFADTLGRFVSLGFVSLLRSILESGTLTMTDSTSHSSVLFIVAFS